MTSGKDVKKKGKDTAEKDIASKKAEALKKKKTNDIEYVGVDAATIKKLVGDGEEIITSLDAKEPTVVIEEMLNKLDSVALKSIHDLTSSKEPGNNQYKLKQATIFAFGKDAEVVDVASKKLAGVMEGLETVFDYAVTKASFWKRFFPCVETFFLEMFFPKPWVETIFL